MKKIIIIIILITFNVFDIKSQILIGEDLYTICKSIGQDSDYPESLLYDSIDSSIFYLSDSIIISDFKSDRVGLVYYIFDTNNICFASVFIINDSISIPPSIFKSIRRRKNFFRVKTYDNNKFNITYDISKTESIFYIWSRKNKVPISWDFIK